jgi:hypothetical protein
VLVELVLQRNAFDVLHHEKRRRVFFFDGVDRNDMVILDRRRRLCFADEACPRRGIGRQLRRQHLNCTDSSEVLIEYFEDSAKAAFADDLQHFVVLEPAQIAGNLRRLQITEIRSRSDAAVRLRLALRRACLELGHHLAKLAGRIERLFLQLLGRPAPRLLAGDQAFERSLTRGARFEVSVQFGGVRLRHSAF